jgi:hypothetical protein
MIQKCAVPAISKMVETNRFKNQMKLNKNLISLSHCHRGWNQGTLTEGEGSIQLTSSLG